MNRTERLLDLITYLLNSKDPVSWRKIKNHFPEDYAQGVEESNQRKFERDKAELISLGIPIDYQAASENQKEGYIIQKEKLFLPEIEFTPEESSLLMLAAGAVLETENFPYREQLESSLHKILSLQPRVTPPPEEIAISYSLPAKASTRTGIINRIQDALDRRKTVEFLYYAFSTGETTQRKVDPYGLTYRKGKWTLVGWDHMRNDLRSFVVNRIEWLEVNARKPGTPDFEIPREFSLKLYQNQQQWELQIHDPIAVMIEVCPHRLSELLPQLLRAERIDEHHFRLPVTNTPGFIAWALSQKTDIQILGPAEIKAQICEVIRDLA